MSYAGAKKRYEENQPDTGDRLPCMWCKEPTARATLSQYGARCFSCFEAYCQGPKPELHSKFSGKPAKPPGKLDFSLPKQGEIDREKAKAETAARVAKYARERGLDLEHQSRAGDPAEQRAHGGESRAAAATNPTPSRAHAPFGGEAVARQGAQR